mgnify:CR=1 FL=1
MPNNIITDLSNLEGIIRHYKKAHCTFKNIYNIQKNCSRINYNFILQFYKPHICNFTQKI